MIIALKFLRHRLAGEDAGITFLQFLWMLSTEKDNMNLTEVSWYHPK